VTSASNRRYRFGLIAPLLALASWTLFVWGGRIRNVVGDPELTGLAFWWRFGLATVLVAGAACVLAVIARHWAALTGTAPGGGDRLLAVPRVVWSAGNGLALLGTVVWMVRGVGIVAGDHGIGFKVVHLVLAAITIGLSGWVAARLRAARARSTGRPEPAYQLL
jgi:hypothetical protein